MEDKRKVFLQDEYQPNSVYVWERKRNLHENGRENGLTLGQVVYVHPYILFKNLWFNYFTVQLYIA